MNVSLKCAVFLFMSLVFSLKASELDDVIPELYEQYKKAITDENNTTSRRVFKNNKQYEIHIQKLKEVNGLKYHNVVLKEKLRNDPNEYIYINNPLESKMSKTFLTVDEFKKELMKRIECKLITITIKTTLSNLLKPEVTRKKHQHTKRDVKKKNKIKSTKSFNTTRVNGRNNVKHVKNSKLYTTRKTNKRSKIKSTVSTNPTDFGKKIDVKTSPTNKVSKELVPLTSLNLSHNKFKKYFKTMNETISYPVVTLKNIFLKTKNTIKDTPIKTNTFRSTTVKKNTIKIGSHKRNSTFGHTTLKKFTTSTTIPIRISTFVNTTTVKLTTADVAPQKDFTVQGTTEVISTKLTHLTQTREESSKAMLATLKNISRNESTYVDTTIKNITIIYAAPEKDLTYEVTTPNEISKRELTFEDITTEKITSKNVISTGESPYDYLKTNPVTIPEENILRIESTFDDTTTEKVTNANVKSTNESNYDNLKIKTLTIPKETLKSELNFENTITESLFAPKEIFKGDTIFEETTTKIPFQTTNFTASQKLTLVDTESITKTKRTPRRKKKVLYITKTIESTKYKRLGRPLVFMGGYGQPVNKHVNDVNLIKL